MSKIIIIGFGSIGKRHYNNLKKLGQKDISIYDPYQKNIEKRIKTIEKINVSILQKFDIAFICNPNNHHISTATLSVKAGCHLFIEKPLSHSLRGVKNLSQICQRKKIINMIACNMRFNPCLKFIKKYLSDKKLGKIYGIHFDTGYYLPFWRPNQDYRKNYAAKKSTGGGMILDGIHSFDLVFWLNNFAPVKKSNIIFDKTSNLKIETEDNFIAAFNFKNKTLGSVRGDYLQKSYSWTCKIVGEKGNLTWDIKENSVWLHNEKISKKIFSAKKFNPNNPYLDEIKYFLKCIKEKNSTFNDIEKASTVLKYCLKNKNIS